MSALDKIRAYTIHGSSRGKFFERDAKWFGIMEVFDIGLDNVVGVRYTLDGSRQAHQISCHGDDCVRALTMFRRGGKPMKLRQPPPSLGRIRIGGGRVRIPAPHQRVRLEEGEVES